MSTLLGAASALRAAATATVEYDDVKRAVVTGAGLVGTHVAAAFAQAGVDVTLADVNPDDRYVERVAGSEVLVVRCDVADTGQIQRLFAQRTPDVVVHAAGMVGAAAQREPFRAYRENAYATACVADGARRAGIRRVCLVSSLAVYGRRLARTAPALAESTVPRPATAYGRTKLAGELALAAVGADLEVVVLRPSGIFGELPATRGGVAAGVVARAVRRALAGSQRVVLEAGLAGTEMLYAPDVGTAAWLAATSRRAAGHVYNVGTGHVASSDALRAAFTRAFGVELIVDGATTQAPLNVKAAASDLGFEARWDLAAALHDLGLRLDRPATTVAATVQGRLT